MVEDGVSPKWLPSLLHSAPDSSTPEILSDVREQTGGHRFHGLGPHPLHQETSRAYQLPRKYFYQPQNALAELAVAECHGLT